jgi:hypothetical protein
MCDKYDVPVMATELLQRRIWTRRNPKTRAVEQWVDNKWQSKDEINAAKKRKNNNSHADDAGDDDGDGTDSLMLTPVEAQIWLLLVNMLCEPTFRERYEVTQQRKDALAGLRKYFHEVLLDQIPVLSELHRAIEEMQLLANGQFAQSQSQLHRRAFVVEEVSQVRESLLRQDFSQLAQQVSSWIFTQDDDKQVMELLSDLYGSSAFEEATMEPTCAKCGKAASNRCSRCKNEWYCSRECQVADWKRHKILCDAALLQRPQQQQVSEV